MVGHVLRRIVFRAPALAQRCCHGEAQPPNKDAIERKMRRYTISRYVYYVRRFEHTLEKNFPSAMHVYRVFVVGIKDFYEDLKEFLSIARWISKRGTDGLSRRELELHFQMPKDMIRVAPVLLISALPFANYVIFPLAYIFPRHLLSRHFWSLQQRVDFAAIALRKRLYNQRPVLRCLQTRLDDLDEGDLRNRWAHIVGLLGSGSHPNLQQIENVRDLFAEIQPFGLAGLWANHKNALVRLHGMHMGWRRRKRLRDRAKILREMDFMMAQEGVTVMSNDELRNACFLRGLNPVNVKTEDLVLWLHKWTLVSGNVDDDHLSLILHLPILIGYNQPSNWVLLYQHKNM
ncbi:LETM1 domain-containing protein 1 [Neocloeon triangulifer]|uniref:LETM1 domain-containing protein 1 n=1 Tax=Neocloeon triangulifer TaxID=2078957 RepID=UPI00286EFB31|nr:LETM1 domain-containing protein 1 [Neocloeon triangulifer]